MYSLSSGCRSANVSTVAPAVLKIKMIELNYKVPVVPFFAFALISILQDKEGQHVHLLEHVVQCI